MKLTVKRFRIRKGEGGPPGAGADAPSAAAAKAAPVAAAASPGDFAPTEDNLGEAPFETARGLGPTDLAAIEAEGLTTRQLRLARRVAQRQGLQPGSDYEAVRLLRLKGIDPFQRSRLMEMVRPGEAEAPPAAEAPAEPGKALLPVDDSRLPMHARGAGLPAQAGEAAVFADLAEIQRDLARRRRRRQRALALRLFLFIFLPTFVAGYYYARIATPLYATFAEFKIDAPDNPLAGNVGSLLRGTGLATSQDAIAVQGYLQSREALRRLDEEEGFRAHFSDPALDPLLRLPEGASAEELYALYRRQVKIAYDPTEGIIRLEVRAAEAESAARFSRALIRYAEAQVDQLTQRVREDQMKGAREALAEAETKMAQAQQALVNLQQELKVLSSNAEVGLVTGQIGALETQLSAERLSLAQMRQNPSPNAARMAPVEQRIQALEGQITELRARLTEGGDGQRSLAEVQSALLMAEADVKTRELLLTQAVQALETARIEANRQVRYLLVSVHPVAPDAAAYPRVFENTLVAFLILAGIYLLLAMTAEILREQMSA